MKPSIRTNIIITIAILIISGLSFAGGFSTRPVATSPDTTELAVSSVSEPNNVYPPRISTSRTGSRSTAAAIPERPVQRQGESDAAYQNRLRAWESEVRRINTASEADKLKKELYAIKSSVSVPIFGTAAVSDNPLIIPTGEMKTEDILTINEDMNVMSQIFRNELVQKGIFPQKYGSVPLWGEYGATTRNGKILIGSTNSSTINSMYIQGYGALFLMNAGFPLTALPETKEKPNESGKGEVDQVWQETRQQIYQSGPTTVKMKQSYDNQEETYDAQKVSELKLTLISALKHAANIRALKADESIILRITGSGQPVKVLAVTKQDNQTLVLYESSGVRHSAVISTDLNDFARSLYSPTVLDIRAKKSDINAFAKGELDFTKFSEKVQVFSYPLISGSADTAR